MGKSLSYIFQDIDSEHGKTFASIFSELKSNDKCDKFIEYKKAKVYSFFVIYLMTECKIQISWVKAKQDCPQGIDASIHNAKLKLLDGSNHETRSGLVFMCPGQASGKISMICTPTKFRNKEKEQEKKWFSLNNVWEREFMGGYPERVYMQRNAWLGNYGVVIEKKDDNVYRLQFSCGEAVHPNITFDDLVVDVTIEGEYTTRFQCSKL